MCLRTSLSLIFILLIFLPGKVFAEGDCLAETLPNLVDGQLIEQLIEKHLPAEAPLRNKKGKVLKNKSINLVTVQTAISGCDLTLMYSGQYIREKMKDRLFMVEMTTTMQKGDRCVLSDLQVQNVDICGVLSLFDGYIETALQNIADERLADQCLQIDLPGS